MKKEVICAAVTALVLTMPSGASASTASLIGDDISAFAIFNNRSASTPSQEFSAPLTVTADATDSFGFGFGDRIQVDVNASSVTLSYVFNAGPNGGLYAAGAASDPCNCLLLSGLNFSGGATISSLSVATATGGFNSISTDLATRTAFGTNAVANFAFPSGPLSNSAGR